jgi:hypothetical protein
LDIFSFFHLHIVVYSKSTEAWVAARENSSASSFRIGLIQVASLASRHEQITVRAAFFLPVTAELRK